nr:hypothetical protein [Porphyridium purpureum]UBY46122.1 hypothetical protein [Porphyridium purpureum]
MFQIRFKVKRKPYFKGEVQLKNRLLQCISVSFLCKELHMLQPLITRIPFSLTLELCTLKKQEVLSKYIGDGAFAWRKSFFLGGKTSSYLQYFYSNSILKKTFILMLKSSYKILRKMKRTLFTKSSNISSKIIPLSELNLVKSISKLKNNKGKYKNLFELVIDPRNLLIAYYTIKERSKNMFTNKMINIKLFQEISTSLLKEEPYFTPIYKTRVLKSRQFKSLHPQPTIFLEDKIVLTAIRNVLEIIYEGYDKISILNKSDKKTPLKEYPFQWPNKPSGFSVKGIDYSRLWTIPPIMSRYSYGYRPERSPHTAIENIQKFWNYQNWLIKIEIKKKFEEINYKRLLNIISTHIEDSRLLKLLLKGLQTKIIQHGVKKVSGGDEEFTDSRMPQSTSLWYLLYNIYMTPSDVFLEKLAGGKYQKKPVVEKDLECKKVIMQAKKYIFAKKKLSHSQQLDWVRNRKKEIEKDNFTEQVTSEINSQSVEFVRYINSFLIAIKGDSIFAKEILNKVKVFLQSNLHLEVFQPRIINPKLESTLFLGFEIKLFIPSKTNQRGKALEAFNRAKRRINYQKSINDKRYLNIIKKLANRSEQRQLLAKAKKINQTKCKLSQLEESAQSKYISQYKSLLENELQKINVVNNFKENFRLTKSEQAAFQLIDIDNLRNISKWRVTLESLTNLTLNLNKTIKEIPYINELFVKTIHKQNELSEILNEWNDKYAGKIIVNQNIITEVNKNTQVVEERAKKIVSKVSTKGAIKAFMPVEIIIQKLKEKGIIHPQKNRPCKCNYVLNKHDIEIIKFFTDMAKSLASYYKIATNIREVRKITDYTFRYSLFCTLAGKHKSSISQIITNYGLSPKVSIEIPQSNQKLIVTLIEYPNKEYFYTMKSFPDKYNQFINIDKLLDKTFTKLALVTKLFEDCSVKNCSNKDIQVYHIRELSRKYKGNIVSTNKTKGKRLNKKNLAFATILTRKQVPLCFQHSQELYADKLLWNNLNQFTRYLILGH